MASGADMNGQLLREDRRTVNDLAPDLIPARGGTAHRRDPVRPARLAANARRDAQGAGPNVLEFGPLRRLLLSQHQNHCREKDIGQGDFEKEDPA